MTIEHQKDFLINHSCACRHLFARDGERLNGELLQDKGNIYFKAEGDARQHLITMFEPDENTDKVTCNRLAKRFIEVYTVRQLQDEFLQALESTCQQEKVHEHQLADRIELLVALTNKIQFNCDAENINTYTAILNYNQSYKSNWNDYKGYLLNFRIQITEDNRYCISLKAKINHDFYTHKEQNIFTKNEILTYLDNWYRVIKQQNQFIETRKHKEFETAQKRNKLQIAINAILEAQNTFIIKTRCTVTGFQYNHCNKVLKFSLRGKGKFNKSNIDEVVDLILKEDTEGYYIKGEKDSVSFSNMIFKPIATLLEEDLYDIL